MVRPIAAAMLISMFAVILALYPSDGFAQSKLPACPSDQNLRWDNCFGTYTLDDGGKYVGEWKEDMSNGQGIYTFPNGEKYVGEFKDDNFNGQGTYTFPNGEKYVGEFKDDKFNGQGTYTFPDGTTYVGEWKDSKFIENDDYTFLNDESAALNCDNDDVVALVTEQLSGQLGPASARAFAYGGLFSNIEFDFSFFVEYERYDKELRKRYCEVLVNIEFPDVERFSDRAELLQDLLPNSAKYVQRYTVQMSGNDFLVVVE